MSERIIFVPLPWPDRQLHPNARLHWAAKAKATKKARHLAQWSCIERGLRSIEGDNLTVTVNFIPPNNIRRDTDGMISSCKAYLDGVSDVVGIDDSKWDIRFKRASPKAPGSVLIEVEKPQ